MRKIRHGKILTLLLAGLLTCPAVALAESFACFHKPHHCAPAPASPPSRCCIAAADTPQPSLTINLVAVAQGQAAARWSDGPLIGTAPHVTARIDIRLTSPPIDRLALFDRLLI